MVTQEEKITSEVKRFFRSGKLTSGDPAAFAVACDRYVSDAGGQSLIRGLKLARQFARVADAAPAPLPLTSTRVLARLCHMNNHYAEAEKIYLEARRRAGRDREVKARIDRALIDVYMYLGQPDKAKRRARQALKTFEELRAPADIAMTKVNYANVLHRQDRHREAEKLYGEAASFFQQQNRPLAVARCYYNQANTLTQLFELNKAERLYRESQKIYASQDRTVDANDAAYGLAWLRMLRGEFHRALIDLSECESVYRHTGQKKGEALCQLDRAEVYLGLNLLQDALEAAGRAEKIFEQLHLNYESAKAALFQSQAAGALDRENDSRKFLARGRAGFQKEQNAGFTAAIELQAARLASTTKEKKRHLTRARKLFKQSQLPLWEAVADLHQLVLSPTDEDCRTRLDSNKAVKHVPHLFAQWQTALGDGAIQRGEQSTARSHWRRAADRLDRVRADLPPVELRSSFGKNISSPHTRLIESYANRSPRTAAAWAERYKTSGIWAPLAHLKSDHPVRDRVERSLSELARRVAVLSTQSVSGSVERNVPGKVRNNQLRNLQKQVRQELATLERHESQGPGYHQWLADQFADVSRRSPVVQFLIADADLLAFVHIDGKTRTVRWVNGRKQIETFLRRWRFYIEDEIIFGDQTGQRNREQDLLTQIGEFIWAPLHVPRNSEQVVILPDGGLSNLPWHAMRVGNRALIDDHLVVFSPSLRHHLKARTMKSQSDQIIVLVPEAADLPETGRELRVFEHFADQSLKICHPAERSDWPRDGRYRIWHFSGHAEFRGDNPFYSYLSMSDGPIFAADFRLRNNPVDLVVLAACRSGEQVAVPGEESLGLVRSLLEMGARNVIAGHWPVADRSAAAWSTAFYTRYLKGSSLADALRTATLELRENFASAYHWAAFSVFGSRV